ncbi:MAG: hypothetical protein ACOVKP_08860, partial [Flavobacterium sp.]
PIFQIYFTFLRRTHVIYKTYVFSTHFFKRQQIYWFKSVQSVSSVAYQKMCPDGRGVAASFVVSFFFERDNKDIANHGTMLTR